MPRPAGTSAGDTRARILDVALELVTERGYAGMSIRDLAERLDLTTAAMYYHFASKEALLDALVEPLTSGLEALAATADGRPAEEVLGELVMLLAGPGARVLPVLMSDPSASRLLKARFAPPRHFEALVRGVAGSDDPLDLLRAQCAISTIQGAVISCAHGQHGQHGQDGHRALDASGSSDVHQAHRAWSGFDEAQTSVVVAAALAALHCGPAG
jgi:AcrR family transcriptional regulator